MKEEPRVVGSTETKEYLSEKQRLHFKIRDFRQLGKSSTGFTRITPPLPCHGFLWRVAIRPERSNGTLHYHISLECCGNNSNTPDNTYSVQALVSIWTNHEQFKTFSNRDPRCSMPLYPWESLLASAERTEGGALTVVVDIQVVVSSSVNQTPRFVWKPKKSMGPSVAALWKSRKYSDITITVDDLDSPNTLAAHKWVLTTASPEILQDMIQMSSQSGNRSLHLTKTDPKRFETLLYMMYTESLPDHWVSDTEQALQEMMELVKLADRFGCTQLKMLLDAEIVESGAVSVASFSEMLAFADAQSLPLLKEAAVDTILSMKRDHEAWATLISSDVWPSLKASNDFMRDLLCQCLGITKPCVSELRKTLSEAGEDVDGTYEMLIKRVNSLKKGEDKEVAEYCVYVW